MTCDLLFLYKFKYQAQFGEVGSENELCSVYYGIYDGQIDANEAEIAEWCYMNPELLDEKLENGSEQFTPWLQMEWRVIRSEYMDKIF